MKANDSSKMVFTKKDSQNLFDQHETLISMAKNFSSSPISNFKVGVLVETEDQTLILGTNLEFPGHHLNFSIHGEQFAVILARELGHKKIKWIVTSAAPCGHCRQFLNEINDPSLVVQVLGQEPLHLIKLFGPSDLGVEGGLLNPQHHHLGKLKNIETTWIGQHHSNFQIKENLRNEMHSKAKAAAQSCYAPYSKTLSGVALLLEDGSTVSGSYVENAAFNPTVAAVHAALIVQRGLGLSSFSIVAAAMAETATDQSISPSYRDFTSQVLKTNGYEGSLDILYFESI